MRDSVPTSARNGPINLDWDASCEDAEDLTVEFEKRRERKGEREREREKGREREGE